MAPGGFFVITNLTDLIAYAQEDTETASSMGGGDFA